MNLTKSNSVKTRDSENSYKKTGQWLFNFNFSITLLILNVIKIISLIYDYNHCYFRKIIKYFVTIYFHYII